MNDNNDTSGDALIRRVLIIGGVVIVVLIVWLAVTAMIVSYGSR